MAQVLDFLIAKQSVARQQFEQTGPISRFGIQLLAWHMSHLLDGVVTGHPEIRAVRKDQLVTRSRAIDRFGYGMASVRFICGTQNVHKQLEERLSRFLGTEDTILYSSCFDANGGLFETLLEKVAEFDKKGE